MTHLSLAPPPAGDPLQPARTLLDTARAARAEADAAERRLLQAAAEWARTHALSATAPGLAAAYWSEGGVPLAGDGAPEVAEFCVAEFAAGLGLSPRAGRSLLGDALELSQRLPRLWERVGVGDLPAWRARRVAQQTLDLPQPGAGFVDQHVHDVAHKVGPAQLDRLVEEARVRHDPERAEELRRERSAARHLDVAVEEMRPDGTVAVDGLLDLADALDLEHALRRGPPSSSASAAPSPSPCAARSPPAPWPVASSRSTSGSPRPRSATSCCTCTSPRRRCPAHRQTHRPATASTWPGWTACPGS